MFFTRRNSFFINFSLERDWASCHSPLQKAELGEPLKVEENVEISLERREFSNTYACLLMRTAYTLIN